MCESVLWGEWGDNIASVNHIYTEFYLLNKGQGRKWRFMFPFYGLSKSKRNNYKLSCHLNKGRFITFHCGPRFDMEMMAPPCRGPARWLALLLSEPCCMAVDDLLPSLRVVKTRTWQLVLWYSGVRWSSRPCPWWTLQFVWIRFCRIGKLFLRVTLANNSRVGLSLCPSSFKEWIEGGSWLESL